MSKPVCLITGAAGAVGQALCAGLVGDCRVIGTYHRRPPSVASQLGWPVDSNGRSPGESAYFVQADLTNRQDLRRLVEIAMARFGGIDCVINCAADIRFHGHLTELWQSDQDVLGQLNVNCLVPMYLVSAVFQECWKDGPDLNASRNRSVINISSVSGQYVYPSEGQAFYGASKAALNFLSLHLAAELAPYSIRVNAISPARVTGPAQMNCVVECAKAVMMGAGTGEIKTVKALHRTI